MNVIIIHEGITDEPSPIDNNNPYRFVSVGITDGYPPPPYHNGWILHGG